MYRNPQKYLPGVLQGFPEAAVSKLSFNKQDDLSTLVITLSNLKPRLFPLNNINKIRNKKAII